jgi:tellurite resistance protein
MRGFLADHLGVFDPDEIRILVASFDKAWEAVQASGVIFDTKAKADTARAILAKHIIAAAKDGEFDQGRLSDGALVALAQSNLSSAP